MEDAREPRAGRRLAAGMILMLAAGALLFWVSRTGDSPPDATEAARRSDPDGSDEMAAREASASATVREEHPASRQESGPDFATLLERLVDHAMDLRALIEEQDEVDDDAVRTVQDGAAATWRTLHREITNPGERALLQICDGEAHGGTPRAVLRRRICVSLVGEALARRQRRSDTSGDRGPLDALVGAVLGGIPRDEVSAQDLGALLTDKPYLGLAHQAAVLDLVTAAAELAFLGRIAPRLLLTLWHNLEQRGERTSSELAAVALLLLDDADPNRRLAALEQLLSIHGGRYRDVALDHVIARSQRDAAGQLAVAAARELPPMDAVAALERLTPVAGPSLMAAFMTLGERDTTAIRAAYDARLAANTNAAFRAELVTGAGFSGSPEAIGMARDAFAYDPDAGVRARAMLVLTAKAGPALGEQTLTAALDDTAFAASAGAAQIAFGLENLARSGDANAVERIGRRLLARSALTAEDRARVEALLQRTLPGGFEGR